MRATWMTPFRWRRRSRWHPRGASRCGRFWSSSRLRRGAPAELVSTRSQIGKDRVMQSCARARAVDDPVERHMLTVLRALIDEQTRSAKPPAQEPGMWLDRGRYLSATEQLRVEQVGRGDQIERKESRLTYVLAPEAEPGPRPLGSPARRFAGTIHGVEVSLGKSERACGLVRDQGHRQPEPHKLCRGPLVLGEVEVLEHGPVSEE